AEVGWMVKAAEPPASEDESRREQIGARNQLDGLVCRVEKDSQEWTDKLPEEAKTRLDAAVEAGKQALRTGETDGIRTALDELNAAYSAAGAALYQSQAGTESAGPAAGTEARRSGAEEEDVVEEDYEIVDEPKK